MDVLVTGGGGFLGLALVRALVAQNVRVRSLSRTQYPELAALGVTQFNGDIADRALVGRAVAGCDRVFHIAAKAGIWGSLREYHQANVAGTRHVLEACREFGVGRLIFTGSPSSVFAGRDQEGIDESTPYPAVHLAHYSRTKAESERMVLAANGPDLATVSLRPHLIWGPGDHHLLPRLADRARKGRLRMVDGGDKLVDSTYIDNAVTAHLLAAERLAPDSPLAGKAYFISNGEPRTLKFLINGLLQAAGVAPVEKRLSKGAAFAVGVMFEAVYGVLGLRREPPMTRFLARQLGTAHWFDISAARRDLGYEPQVTIEAGLAKLKAHWQREKP